MKPTGKRKAQEFEKHLAPVTSDLKADKALQYLFDAEAFLHDRSAKRMTAEQWGHWSKAASRLAQLVKRLRPKK